MNRPSMSEQQGLLPMPPDEYMNAQQLDFFNRLLLHERETLLNHIEYLKTQLKQGEQHSDEADKAMREEELRLLFRQIDRESRLVPKFDAALQRMKSGEYGYCRETGDPIGIARLLLRPTAELSIDAKARQEIVEAQYRK